MLGGYQLIHVWYQQQQQQQQQILQVSSNKLFFGVAMGGLLLKLQNFKKVKLI